MCLCLCIRLYIGTYRWLCAYKDICYGETYHAEVVKLVYDCYKIDTFQLLKIFWEGHNPTQGMRQGNDIGTQYRSIIITTNEKQFELAKSTKNKYEELLKTNGFPKITTEIQNFKNFYYAEEYHQQYLLKNPNRDFTGLFLNIEIQVLNTKTESERRGDPL